MNSQKKDIVPHSSEPWSRGDEHEGMTSIVDGKGNCIARVKKGWILDFPGASGNARRILACVNACAGIPTECLESGTVAEFFLLYGNPVSNNTPQGIINS